MNNLLVIGAANTCACVSAYRPLSAFKTQDVIDILKRNTSLAVCIIANNLCKTKLWFKVRGGISLWLGLVLAAACRLLVLRMSLTSYVLNADSGRYTDTLISHILCNCVALYSVEQWQ